MEGDDYVIETRQSFDARIIELEEKLRDAIAEADLARMLPGLDGPTRASDRDVQRLRAQIADLRQLADTVDQGYVHFDRLGFEQAIDACGEWFNWHTLADTFVGGAAFGHDDAEIRLPLDALAAYQRAVNTGLFNRFELCVCFDLPVSDDEPPHGPFTHYLFGARNLATIQNGLFLIAQWVER